MLSLLNIYSKKLSLNVNLIRSQEKWTHSDKKYVFVSPILIKSYLLQAKYFCKALICYKG